MDFQDLIPTLQVAIGPVILISGIGLLLPSTKHPHGRVERAVCLGAHHDLPGRPPALAGRPVYRDAFIGCMAALIASLLAFLRDINLALDAVRVEVQTRRARSAFGPSRDER